MFSLNDFFVLYIIVQSDKIYFYLIKSILCNFYCMEDSFYNTTTIAVNLDLRIHFSSFDWQMFERFDLIKKHKSKFASITVLQSIPENNIKFLFHSLYSRQVDCHCRMINMKLINCLTNKIVSSSINFQRPLRVTSKMILTYLTK